MTYSAKVISWHQREDYHVCLFEDGSESRIDLMVGGTLGELNPKELVGKSIEFARLHPYVSIAHGVRVVDETKVGEPL